MMMTLVTIRADITLSYSAWDEIVKRTARRFGRRKNTDSVDQYVHDLLQKARNVEVHRLVKEEKS